MSPLSSVLIFLRFYNRLRSLLEEETSFVDPPGLAAVALIAPMLIISGIKSILDFLCHTSLLYQSVLVRLTICLFFGLIGSSIILTG